MLPALYQKDTVLHTCCNTFSFLIRYSFHTHTAHLERSHMHLLTHRGITSKKSTFHSGYLNLPHTKHNPHGTNPPSAITFSPRSHYLDNTPTHEISPTPTPRGADTFPAKKNQDILHFNDTPATLTEHNTLRWMFVPG